MPPSAEIQKFLEEEKSRASRKQELIKQLLAERDAKIQEYDDQLALLGYMADVPRLTPSSGGAQRKKRVPAPGAICSICKFATEPYHDGRLKLHRDQGKAKKPLTDAQLKDAGLAKVS